VCVRKSCVVVVPRIEAIIIRIPATTPNAINHDTGNNAKRAFLPVDDEGCMAYGVGLFVLSVASDV